MDLRVLIHERPHVFHIILSSLVSIIALSMSPPALPLTLTVAILLLYAPRIFNRRAYGSSFGYTVLLWLSISLFGSIGRLAPALSALSTPGTSLTVIIATELISSALAISAIGIDFFICSRIGARYQIVLFPAVWSTFWMASSRLPLGRLLSWSPVLGTQAYGWITPWVGPAGIDWIVAAWAVVISQGIGSWFMGTPDEDTLPSNTSSTSSGRSILAVILAALAIPSFFLNGLPLPVGTIDSVTPLEVGCALPPFWKYHHTTPTVDDYIHESRTLSSAKVVLWPEGAVSFGSENPRKAGLNYIAYSISTRHTYWAVPFEEDIEDASGGSVRRTGMALLSNGTDGPVVEMEYFKRHLVPIAETFYLSPGSEPPPLYSLALTSPSKVNKTDWAPESDNYTRSILLTASICLDFATPSPFHGLDSKPALILAPARTWDPAIGRRMWEEAKQRANEIGSLALWCDGGKGGVSGVAGGVYNDVYQVSAGSWSRIISFPYPFDPSLTLYGHFGDTVVLAVSWLVVIGPSTFPMISSLYRAAAVRALCSQFGMRVLKVVGLKQEPTPNLIDF